VVIECSVERPAIGVADAPVTLEQDDDDVIDSIARKVVSEGEEVRLAIFLHMAARASDATSAQRLGTLASGGAVGVAKGVSGHFVGSLGRTVPGLVVGSASSWWRRPAPLCP
jgi:hypothetical protein